VTVDPSVVLVGGQAVEFWARFLGLDMADSSAELLASKNIDFERSADAARAAADLLGGRSRLPSVDHHTPLTGVMFVDDSDGIERRIDFLVSPLGPDGRDVRDTAVDVEIGARRAAGDSLWAVHPERVMDSPLANIEILGIAATHRWSRSSLTAGAPRAPESLAGGRASAMKAAQGRHLDAVRAMETASLPR
jgi:hypothetical protein